MKLTVDYIDLARPAMHDGQQTNRITGPLKSYMAAGRPATYEPFEIELDGVWVLIPQKDGRRLRLPSQDCQVMECREQPAAAAPGWVLDSVPALIAPALAPEPTPVVEKARGNKKTR
jgi:hypothetical protein